VAFTLCVTAPWHLGGFRAVTADTRGVWAIRTSTQESRACAAAWDDRPGALLHCVLDYESKNPEKGFPSTISEMGERGTNCLGYRFTPKGDSVRLRDYLDYSLTYFSDAPGPDGRISGFHITGAAPFNAEPALFVDQTGIWRATDARRERRPARPDDPPWPREKVGTP
jgi:hypothetical protein